MIFINKTEYQQLPNNQFGDILYLLHISIHKMFTSSSNNIYSYIESFSTSSINFQLIVIPQKAFVKEL